MEICDFLVIGGGIIGLNVARELKRRFSDSKVTLIEKERACGLHASGRNSGVLHAGFYYTADSLKARFTRDGNRELTEYCEQHDLPVNHCGKLVVAKDEAEDRLLDELLRRAHRNGVVLEELTLEEAKRIEPRVKTYARALFSPTTASADPKQVIRSMEQEARREGVEIRYGAGYVRRQGSGVVTRDGEIDAGYVVNAGGLYADSIAKDFGFSKDYAILPFKGLYLKSDEPPGAYKTNIYPVPDLKNPFLGVHFTVQVKGNAKIGPTAIPALWREQYNGVKNFRLSEFVDIAARSTALMVASEFEFKRLALSEVRKYSRHHMVHLAKALATEVDVSRFRHWAEPGIRAQMIHTKTGKLEMDFVLEGDNRSMHVLNAVSPGWTCSLPFTSYVSDEIEKRVDA
jgi:L-2-hydroxyglutarate oxidase LhgO